MVVSEIFIDPDFGFTLFIEPNHIVIDEEWSTFVVCVFISFKRSIKHIQGFWVGELWGM